MMAVSNNPINRSVSRLLIHELIIILALITILGGVIGYSLAAGQLATSETGLPQKAVLVSSDELD